MPKRLFTDQQEQEIAAQYLARNPDGTWTGANELAVRWGTIPQTIYNALARQGVQTRDAAESHAHGKRCKPIVNLPPEDEPAPLCKCGCSQPVQWHQRRNRWNAYVSGHYRQPALYKSDEWLSEQYLVQHRTLKSIADQFGVNETTIRKFMRKFDIPVRTQRESLLLSGAVAGKNNPAWKGGTTPERQRLYKTPKWKKLVKQVFARDHYTCQRCRQYRSTNNIRLETHHLHSWADHPDRRTDPNNLITLCQDCHRWVHSLENTNRDYILD